MWPRGFSFGQARQQSRTGGGIGLYLQADGIAFAGGARWRGRQAMRVSVISWLTDKREGEHAADAMIAAWREVR
ncbi:hypothetical protein MesoLj131a_45110 [Mesorhizobium sp. 131-2-1]|nr:hypothetical protein MesoLj131a_45110 [Mesorhizobium sp. 131-2-1]